MGWWMKWAEWVPCHRRPDRCLRIKGKPMPICARCFSILLGYWLIPVFFFLPVRLPWYLGVLSQIPMLVDGFTQKWGWRESNNLLRVITGLLSGSGLALLAVAGTQFLVEAVERAF
ncbi:MAG: DUF2085 domain-containing protein [Thermoactinomyces sp.]